MTWNGYTNILNDAKLPPRRAREKHRFNVSVSTKPALVLNCPTTVTTTTARWYSYTTSPPNSGRIDWEEPQQTGENSLHRSVFKIPQAVSCGLSGITSKFHTVTPIALLRQNCLQIEQRVFTHRMLDHSQGTLFLNIKR